MHSSQCEKAIRVTLTALMFNANLSPSTTQQLITKLSMQVSKNGTDMSYNTFLLARIAIKEEQQKQSKWLSITLHTHHFCRRFWCAFCLCPSILMSTLINWKSSISEGDICIGEAAREDQRAKFSAFTASSVTPP